MKSFYSTIVQMSLADLEPFDFRKMAKQLKAVYGVMKDGRWRTLAEIAFHAGAPEASVSARIRDLERLNGIVHMKRKAKQGSLFEYRLII